MSDEKEELNIDGVEKSPPVPDASKIEQTIGANTPDVSSMLDDSLSADQVLERILATPTEQLIPWEECVLPSGGLYYGWPDGVIQVRAMNQKAEKILATQRLASTGQSIDYLFRECAKFPDGFDAADLLLGDRVFLLYFLRGITHGNMYEFAVSCPNQDCQSVQTHAYDLNELAATIRPADKSLGSEPFKVSLPYLSKVFKRDIWVSTKFLRAYDASDVLARRRVRKKITKPGRGPRNARSAVDPRKQKTQQIQIDNALDDNLEKVIVNIMGDADPMKIRQFVQKMHASDTATIREWLKQNTPGIDNTIMIECSDCGGDFTVELPITESFFRPTESSATREAVQ